MPPVPRLENVSLASSAIAGSLGFKGFRLFSWLLHGARCYYRATCSELFVPRRPSPTQCRDEACDWMCDPACVVTRRATWCGHTRSRGVKTVEIKPFQNPCDREWAHPVTPRVTTHAMSRPAMPTHSRPRPAPARSLPATLGHARPQTGQIGIIATQTGQIRTFDLQTGQNGTSGGRFWCPDDQICPVHKTTVPICPVCDTTGGTTITTGRNPKPPPNKS